MQIGLLFNQMEEGQPVCNNVDESGGCHVQWNKPDIERQILYDFYLYVESKIFKLIEGESRMLVTRALALGQMLVKG